MAAENSHGPSPIQVKFFQSDEFLSAVPGGMILVAV